MKLGCQSAPTNETHLKYFARYGVRNICGYPTIADGRLYATVDELKSMTRSRRQRTASASIAWRRRSSRPATSTGRSIRAIMLAQSPERDRDIESMQTMIRTARRPASRPSSTT